MDTEVLVVGAGPTGLLLAGDLARAGVDVTVVDRHPGESPLTRAFAVHARTLEMLDARGCADAVIATGTPLSTFRLLGSIDADLSVLPSRYNYVLITPQYNVGNVLARRAADLGVTIRRPVEVVGLTHHGPTSDVAASDGVTVRVREGLGSEDTISAQWVVGADGHHSTVRRAVGIDFPGESIVQSLVLADVRMTEPPADVLTTNGNRHGFCFVVPFGDGWYRVITRDQSVDLPDTAPVELEEVKRTAKAVFGTDFGMHDPRWLSRFHSEERQATAYRRGRVLLAGDAAHVHSPAGGMGMNTGLQDAANLGWKLAAVANGWAHEDLLDSYEAERHPVGELALKVSGGLVRGGAAGSALSRALRGLALRGVLALPPVRDKALGVVSGLGLRYHPPVGATRDAGLRAEAVPGIDGHELAVALRGGRFVLVLPEVTAADFLTPPGDGPEIERVTAQVSRWVLVRPDGYVAASGRSDTELSHSLASLGLADARSATRQVHAL